jgi:hypothetical protein
LAPFAVKDGSRLGAHALALIEILATGALEKGRRPPPPRLASASTRRWLLPCPLFGHIDGSNACPLGSTWPPPRMSFASYALTLLPALDTSR